MAYTVSATGWTWDYVEWQLDIPRLLALNAHWSRLPPPALQLARIAAAIGLKSDAVPAAPTTPAAQEEQAGSLMEMFPTAPAQPFLSAEEYLRQKNAGVAPHLSNDHGQQ